MDGRCFVIRTISRIHRLLYRVSGGRMGAMMGGPVLLLTTTGRKSGRKRCTPLFYIELETGWAVAGSNAGMNFNPGWWANLKADPRAVVQIARLVTTVKVRQADPNEWDELWPMFVAMYAGYEDYREQARREIPIAILQRENG